MASVRVVEVGPRDGLQNVKTPIPSPTKLALIQKLCEAGLQHVEITSVVSPKSVPQLADCQTILADSNIQKLFSDPRLRAPVLIPNLRGLGIALQNDVKEVAVFVSATEGFSRANIKCSVQEGLERARKVSEKARAAGVSVRGYISCIFGCPFDGPTPRNAVLQCVRQLLDMGCYEVSMGDTIGVGVPTETQSLIKYLVDAGVPIQKLAGHFHDTCGQAIANMWAGYRCGMRVFDSSVGGLGGCPYAPGAKGNLTTEDLVYSLEQAGVSTGVNLAKIVVIGAWITKELDVPNCSRAGSALFSKTQVTKAGVDAGKATSQTTPSQWVQQPAVDGLELYRDGVNLKLVLNRQRNGNALTASMISQITEVFENAATDDTIARIVLAANGKLFCTGMDLSRDNSPVAKSSSAIDAQYSRLTQLFEAIDNAPQVTIACIQGPAYGGGVGLALVCDIRLMVADACLKLSEVRLGLAPATISKYVVRELGISFSREVMLSARPVSAQELLQLGKIAEIIATREQATSAIDERLRCLRACAPRASTLTKRLVTLGWRHAGGLEQSDGIKGIFTDIMAQPSESVHGLAQFQRGVKEIDWDAYVSSKIGPKARARL